MKEERKERKKERKKKERKKRKERKRRKRRRKKRREKERKEKEGRKEGRKFQRMPKERKEGRKGKERKEEGLLGRKERKKEKEEKEQEKEKREKETRRKRKKKKNAVCRSCAWPCVGGSPKPSGTWTARPACTTTPGRRTRSAPRTGTLPSRPRVAQQGRALREAGGGSTRRGTPFGRRRSARSRSRSTRTAHHSSSDAQRDGAELLEVVGGRPLAEAACQLRKKPAAASLATTDCSRTTGCALRGRTGSHETTARKKSATSWVDRRTAHADAQQFSF